MSTVPPPLATAQVRRRLAPALRRLNAVAPLNDAETRLMERCAERGQEQRTGKVLLEEGVAPRPMLVLAGWACRQRVLSDGRRQIIDILTPGDVVGVGAWPEPPTTGLVALTRMETADAASLRIAALDAETHPNLVRALAVYATEAQARLLDHIVRLGRHTAYERTAHLLTEIVERLNVAGVGDGRTYPFPVTQQVLADLLGLSIVHVNRTLQQLRRDKLIVLNGGGLVVLDAPGLASAAGRSPPPPA